MKKKGRKTSLLNKKHTTVMMAGTLVGFSFMGAKKLIQGSDLAISILKDELADKEKTIKAAHTVGFHCVLDKCQMGTIGRTLHQAGNINIGIVNVDKESLDDETAVRQCIVDARTEGAEFILVYAGFNGDTNEIAAKMLAEAGADYIVGYGKKKAGPYSVIVTKEDKYVPVIYSCGNIGGKQGKVMILELQLMKNRQGIVEIKSEGYHPCLANGSIVPIDDALKTCNNDEERIQFEDAIFTIKSSMGINERCKCYVSDDKTLTAKLHGNYSSLQRKYEVQPILTARKKQIESLDSARSYHFDEKQGCYIRDRKEAEREAAIICTGQIEYDSQMEEDAECFGHFEFRKSFKAISECFKGNDFVIGNLNSMASAEYPGVSEVSKRTAEAGYCNCRIEFLEALGQAGVTGIAVSNVYNASLGIEGIIDTEKAIRRYNMISSGIGYDKTPVVDINGIRVGFVSITTECIGVNNNLTGEAAAKFLNIFDVARIKSEIGSAKNKGAEFILMYINCGIGESLLSLEERRSVAETAANIGADYIVCTGPREVSELYRYVAADGRTVPIATSLGRFTTGSKETDSYDSAMIKVMIRRRFDGSIQMNDELYHETNAKVSAMLGDQIKKNQQSEIKIKEGFTKNFTIAELYEFFEKTPSEEDLTRFGDKYHKPINFFTAKETAIQEDCVAILYDYINYGKTEEFEWDIQKCVDTGVLLVIDNKYHDELPCIVVDEPLIEVYRKLANKIINRYDPVKVAITGSMGKTTTKEMTVEVFNNHFRTVTNSGNINVIFNIGLIMQKIQEDDEAYVQEVHGGTIGMASDISKMIEPDICILTNIEKNHMSQVGTVENLIKAKMGIIDGLKPDGVLIMCNDNQYLRDMDPPVRTIRYSISDSSCHYYGRNIRTEGDDLLFDIVVKESEFDNEGIYAARINMQGEHNVGNAIAAFAAGRQAGIPPHEIIAGLSRYRTSGIRQNMFEHNGIKMIMDTHNSNPVALLSMFDVFDRYESAKGGEKILVLGMMGEQGEDSRQIHYDTGKAISKHDFDVLFCFGEDAKYMVQAVKECGKEAYYFSDRTVFNRVLAENVKPGDVVMVKGSHALKLDTATMVPIFGKNIRDH